MEQDERLRLIGEQTLLSEERHQQQAQRSAQERALLTLYNQITACHNRPNWLEQGVALMQTLAATQERLVELDIRINELRTLTGR